MLPSTFRNECGLLLESYSCAAQYVPLEGKRRMRHGAEEEAGVRGPRGPPETVPFTEILKMPE